MVSKGPLSEDELFRGYGSSKAEVVDRLLLDPKFEGLQLRNGDKVTLQMWIEDGQLLAVSIVGVEYAEV